MSTFGSGALRGLAFALLTLAQLCFAAHASAQAGTVLATNGENEIQRAAQTIAPLKPGIAVQSADTIVTEAKGRLQVRFVDGAIVSMQPATQFRVDQYQFNQAQESSFFSLLRGAVRMATGLIGKKDPKQWRMSTPSATIGIRGTHFVVEHTVCDPDCSPGDKPGTRVAVTQGEVVVSNASGSIVLSSNQSAYVSDLDSPPLADQWTPELLPRTVPSTPTPSGPGNTTRGANGENSNDGGQQTEGADNNNGPGNNADPDNPDNAGSDATPGTNDSTGSKPVDDGSGAVKPIRNGANNGLRWQPDPVNPYEPVRDIALVDLEPNPHPGVNDTPASNQPPDNSAGNTDPDASGSETTDGIADNNDSRSDDSRNDSGGELAGTEDPDSNGGDLNSGDSNSGDSNNGGTNNTPQTPGSGSNEIANGPRTGENNPDITDPVDDGTNTGVGDPGEPMIRDPNLAESDPNDSETNNPNDPNKPNNPGMSNSTIPQTGSSFASNWFLGIRPLPTSVQQGLLSDPQSAVTFGEGITLESIGNCDGGICISRGTAQVTDAGHDEYAAWGRWTNGEMHIQVFGLTRPVALSENEGLHYIVGSPTVTVPTNGSFSYNLTGATSPTMSHDWYAPGSFDGKASVQFSAGHAPRVGLNARVNIANDQFRFNTTGGAADPSQSELTLDSNLRFSGQLNASGGQETLPWMCGSVGCRTQVEGALFGPTGERLGVNYSIQSESGSTRINGVGIFSRP